MFINRIRDVLLIVAFIACYLKFFPQTIPFRKYHPISGTLYDIEISSIAIRPKQIEDTPIFTSKKIPTLNLYSILPLPEEFLAKTVKSKSIADYIVVSEKFLKQKFIYKPQIETPPVTEQKHGEKIKKISKPQKRKTAAPKSKPTTKKKESKQESQIELSYYTVRDIVRQSQKTYFYPEKLTQSKNIQLAVLSFTPYQDEAIIKFQVKNSSKQYFFIANLRSLAKQSVLSAKFFNEPFVAPGKSITGYCLLPKNIKKQLTLELTESGGKQRCLKIDFATP